MNKIVAFGASSSSRSINHQLAQWVADQLEDVEVSLLDLNDYEMPIYSTDRERRMVFRAKLTNLRMSYEKQMGSLFLWQNTMEVTRRPSRTSSTGFHG